MKQSMYRLLLILAAVHITAGITIAQNNLRIVSPVLATPGMDNTMVGVGAGNTTMTGWFNTLIGRQSGTNLTTGTGNTAIGYVSALSITTGGWNTMVGYAAGSVITVGEGNVLMGGFSGSRITSGRNNTFLGYFSGYDNTIGVANTFVGNQSGTNNTTGYSNVLIGEKAGYSNTTGDNNVMVGDSAGYTATTSVGNTMIGSKAGYRNITGGNSFVGYQAGYNTITGNNNTFLGYQAGYRTNSNYENTYMGHQAGYNLDGAYNVMLGSKAGFGGTAGAMNADNAFIGYRAGYLITTGSNNAFIGSGSGAATTTGGQNVYIGHQAGDANTTGSRNTLVGAGSDVLSANLINAAAIGYNARVAVSNAIVLGDPANTSLNVGIGTDSPQYPLDVRGIINVRGAGGKLKFSSLSNPRYRQGYTDQFLTVDAEGETVLARYRLQPATASEWADHVFTPGYRLRPLTEVAKYVETRGHLPGIPSAATMAAEGIDATQMSARLLEKIEELTLYIIAQKQDYQQQIDALKAENQTIKRRLQKR